MTMQFSSRSARNSRGQPVSDLPGSATPNFLDVIPIEVQGSGRVWRSLENSRQDESQSPKRRAYVAAASVVAFADGVFAQQREDLLNSTLMAQLAANRKYDREKEAVNWYRYYRSILQNLGWSRTVSLQPDQAPPHGRNPRVPVRVVDVGRLPEGPGLRRELPSLPFVQVNASRPRFSAGPEMLGILRRKMPKETYNTINSAVEALQSLGERDRRVVIFENSSHSLGSGNFQILSVHVTSTGNLQMTLAACFFSTNEKITRVLSHNFTSNATRMFQAQDVMTLNSEEYAAVRPQVIQRLGDQVSIYIDEIDLE